MKRRVFLSSVAGLALVPKVVTSVIPRRHGKSALLEAVRPPATFRGVKIPWDPEPYPELYRGRAPGAAKWRKIAGTR